MKIEAARLSTPTTAITVPSILRSTMSSKVTSHKTATLPDTEEEVIKSVTIKSSSVNLEFRDVHNSALPDTRLLQTVEDDLMLVSADGLQPEEAALMKLSVSQYSKKGSRRTTLI
jgi:hypothetical protein